jgi:sugar/nucleoside kinase (ribokinase family)
MIIIDRHERAAFYEVMRLKKSTTAVLIDPSTEVSDFTLDMIRQAEHPVVPIETLVHLPGDDLLTALDALHTLANKPVTVTAGALGCVLYDGTVVEIVRPLALQSIDTSGAGDVYRGAYAYGILQGWSQRRTASFANTIAGMQCTSAGNMSAIPHGFTMLQAAKVRPAKLKQVYLRDIAQCYRELCEAQQSTATTQQDTIRSYS